MSLQRHLVVFARAPRIGRVKTRLAGNIGMVAAWAFYRRMLERTHRRFSGDPRWDENIILALLFVHERYGAFTR